MPTLILSPRYTEDSQILWRTAGQLGWDVERLTSWRVPAALRTISEPVLYAETLSGQMLAEQFGLRLIEPALDWLPRLPETYRKRQVELVSLATARSRTTPAFIKPPNDKSFPAQVYLTGAELPNAFEPEMPVLVAEVVAWEKEFRCFALERQPRTLSIYKRGTAPQRHTGFAATALELAEAKEFVQVVCAAAQVDLPRATVLDVGVITGRGWAVVEQNTAWGAGLYGCDPAAVLEVLRHAAVVIADEPV